MTKRKTDVHTEHCCTKHGCKYNDPNCSVTTHRLRQSDRLACEWCYDLEERYQRALKRLLIKKGSLVITSGTAFGWVDYGDGMAHIRSCGFDVSRIEEDASWTEFAGTFADHDDWHHGMEMVVTCTCGKYTDRMVRWDGRVAEAIRDIIELSD